MTLEGWNVLDEDRAVMWREYAFTKGARATTMVFRGADGLVVLSPAAGMDDRAFDMLGDLGPVRALVATNTHHHMGQASWRKRFPDAATYAPPGAVSVLTKKLPGIAIRPLTELSLPDHVRYSDAPGFKGGETLLSVDTKRGPVRFTGDLLTNIERLPPPPIRWLFTMTDSAPGFRLFRPATWIMVKDKRVLREWMLAELAAVPPSIVVPAHGQPVDAVDVAAQARRQIERL